MRLIYPLCGSRGSSRWYEIVRETYNLLSSIYGELALWLDGWGSIFPEAGYTSIFDQVAVGLHNEDVPAVVRLQLLVDAQAFPRVECGRHLFSFSFPQKASLITRLVFSARTAVFR